MIIPGAIFGPSIIEGDYTSGVFMRMFMNGELPGIPKIMLPYSDVRDVAFAHVQAIKVAEAANQRFLLTTKSIKMLEIN